jgi:phenylacetic acid degradation operon negative regulatory protein
LPANTLVFDANLADHLTPGALVGLGWDLADLGKRYRRFVQRFERALGALRRMPIEPTAAFMVRTLLIHEYRRLHLRDPLLPQRLLPANWPGTRAAVLCREIYVHVFAASEIFLSAGASRLSGPLPSPDRAVMQRFGGLEL